MRFIDREFVRFVFFGGVNSLLSYILYALFLLLIPYQAAYTLSYVLGILFSYLLNTRYVYRAELRLTKALQYPLVYLVQYLLSIGLLYSLVEVFHVAKLLAPALIVLATIPVTFLLSRFIIKGYRMASSRG